MTQITIRLATPADVTRMFELWYERMALLLQTDRHFTMLPDAQAKWKQAMLPLLTQDDYTVFVGDAGAEVIGYILAHQQVNTPGLAPEGYGVIDELVVDAHTAYPGAAKALLTAAVGWFQHQQLNQYVVTVSRYHAVEQAFWQTFRSVRRTEDLWIRL